MVRKSICLSALLALGMVGSSFAQNLSDAAQAQVGTSSDSSSWRGPRDYTAADS